jgi:hypothetical protein
LVKLLQWLKQQFQQKNLRNDEWAKIIKNIKNIEQSRKRQCNGIPFPKNHHRYHKYR